MATILEFFMSDKCSVCSCCPACGVWPCLCETVEFPAVKDNGLPVKVPTQPLFEQRANATIAKVTATFGQRGTEYGDTWRNCRFVVMKAIARDLKLNIPDEAYRALATAAFVDMKYQRNEGGYKEDSLIDGIAYSAFLADEMRELKEGK